MSRVIVSILLVVTGYFTFLAFPSVAKYITAKQEFHECLVWQDQEVQFERMGWFSANYQKEQCQQYGIYFNN